MLAVATANHAATETTWTRSRSRAALVDLLFIKMQLYLLGRGRNFSKASDRRLMSIILVACALWDDVNRGPERTAISLLGRKPCAKALLRLTTP
ncbi:hypothetical protein CC86DRAFT_22838 [Ophiobolus disseminans]|uniref:Uncharacterized protein n=1 Tax=Ophiobolus disseminans TaxID=1469910 RepID=A0A6A7A2H5_9PLEO|nr:hypothetical protein CC86DRAFT_22838 [Ophiobolus disseminans]